MAGIRNSGAKTYESGSGHAAQELSSPIDPAGAEPSQRTKRLAVSRDRDSLQRVRKVRPASTAHLVTASFDGENAAQLCMVTAKSKLKRARERMRDGRPQWNLVGCYVLQFPLDSMFSSAIVRQP
jgi:hypothetical protein